jgi:formylglycine-generating enzyme required for sulfatase activity
MSETRSNDAERLRVGAKIAHGADDGLFRPGAGRTEWFKDLALAPEMVVVPAGRFAMGSPESEAGRSDDEGPQHGVMIPEPFAVSRYAITFAEWDAAVAARGVSWTPGDEGWGRGPRPAVSVSWHDAKAYAAWLSAATGEDYRLPSEAEWEYVARAGSTTPFWWGEDIAPEDANCDFTQIEDYADSVTGPPSTVEVDRFAPNAWGLYQVHGNVWEWIEDPWHDDYAGAPDDASVWRGGEESARVVRGGAWAYHPQDARAAVRLRFAPGTRFSIVGFRLVRSLRAQR